jgi:hypothetical protein
MNGEEQVPGQRVQRKTTIHDIVEARHDIERAWAKYFGITLHEALWPQLYGKAPSDKR